MNFNSQKEEEKLKPVRAKPKKRGEGGSGRSHAGNATYREEEGSDEEGAISLNAIKNKYKSGQAPNKGDIQYFTVKFSKVIFQEALFIHLMKKVQILKPENLEN